MSKAPVNRDGENGIFRLDRREIELGLADSKANRTTPAEDVLKEFGFDA